MLTEINPKNPQERLIIKVVDILKKGGIIAYPTDTYYGIGCDIMNKKAIEKIYQLKQRNRIKPFSFICSGLKNISDYAKVSNYAYKTMKRLLPGPYSFWKDPNWFPKSCLPSGKPPEYACRTIRFALNWLKRWGIQSSPQVPQCLMVPIFLTRPLFMIFFTPE